VWKRKRDDLPELRVGSCIVMVVSTAFKLHTDTYFRVQSSIDDAFLTSVVTPSSYKSGFPNTKHQNRTRSPLRPHPRLSLVRTIHRDMERNRLEPEEEDTTSIHDVK
jgi:hypothetical protein